MVGGGSGLGIIFRTRTERDAKAFIEERAQRDHGGSRSRAELVAIVTIAVVTLAVWGVVGLVG
ncbi:hypothetical protein [Salsipaludibacter albus]|uniref:hypothetical protein n=1 Tax=Salsipaludibacter albus TaxID=2849650 RepID=UPI001EE4B3FC|nr:hypothetical protein [Salsipaludibacter albus]MBY5162298.1 hypothetical protein [Salsipaludibacter albus]